MNSSGDGNSRLIPANAHEGTVSVHTFRPVSGAFLETHWTVLEAASVPIFRIHGRVDDAFQVSVLTKESLDTLPESQRSEPLFAIPNQWLAGETAQQYQLGWDQEPFFLRWHALLQMAPAQRIESFRSRRQEFEARLRDERDPEARAKLIASVTETAFLANKACMSLDQGSLGEFDKDLVHETILTIQAVLGSIEESALSSTLLLALRSISTGPVSDHIVRVFTLGSAFLLYVKKVHGQNLALRLRAGFAPVYQSLYREILPRVGDRALTSDNVVRIKSYSTEETREQALGLLLHDLGKATDLGYFEGKAKYDAARIQQHSILGSGLFLRTYGHRFEQARYIIGDHHNYLFHPDGYGLTRWDRARGQRRPGEPGASVADTLDSYIEGQTLAYFPVEVCTNLDIYDSLTVSRRANKPGRTPAQALELMASDFVLAGKLDPVIFDLFVDFLRVTGVDSSEPGLEERLRTRMPWVR